MRIVFVCTEVQPWTRVGGLADFMCCLPEALARLGHRVMSICPRYDQYPDTDYTNRNVVITTNGCQEEMGVHHLVKDGVDRVFLDHPIFLDPARQSDDNVYGPTYGVDWSDNQTAFSMMCNAALRVIQNIPFGGSTYGEDIVIVANDWHAGLVPVYVAAEREACGAWSNAKVFFLIHNIRYQGVFLNGPQICKHYNLPQHLVDSMLMYDGACVQWIKGGARWADRVLTVSPTYACEVQSALKTECGLNYSIGLKDVFGISNGVCTDKIGFMHGIDVASESIASHIDETCLFKKSTLKRQVQQQFGLREDSNIPLFLFMGLIDHDKGVDVILAAFSKYVFPVRNVTLVVAGYGDPALTQRVREAQIAFPTKIVFDDKFRDYDVAGRSRYLAAADWLLLPSRSDPCSLLHFEAMKFGTIPIASCISGFKDTISHLQNGVLLRDLLEPTEDTTDLSARIVGGATLGVLELSRQPAFLSIMQRAAMSSATNEHSWREKAKLYEKVFASDIHRDGVWLKTGV